MRVQRPLFTLLIVMEIFALPILALASYQVAPSTGSGLPYSLETKSILKHLYNNRTVVGGQVIALKDQPGKNFSGNYIDVGDLGGVKKNDVFALYTPKGEPVGFIRVVETQHYTSSFEFVELTVDPSDNLSAKKITEEVRGRLPESLLVYPDMRHFKKGTRLALKNQKLMPPQTPYQSSLPPLPGQSPASSMTSTLPPLPGENASASSGSALPPLPESGTASTGGGLPPLPMDNSSFMGSAPGGELPELPPAGDSGLGLPPMSPDNSMPGAGLPPLGNDNSSSSLPPMDNGLSGLPELPGDDASAQGSLPPLLNTAPDSGLPALPGDNSGAPSLPPPGPGGVDMGLPPLPGADSSMPGLPPDNSTAMPPLGGDMSLPPLSSSSGQAPENGLPMPPQSQLPPDSLPPGNSNVFVEAGAVPPGLDSSLPSLPEAEMPPPSPLAQTPPVPNSDLMLLPMDNSVLPPSSNDMLLPPMADATLPSAIPEASSVPELPSPVGFDSSMPPLADASLPPVPGEMPSGQLADNQAPPPMMDNSFMAPPAGIVDLSSQASVPPSFEVPGLNEAALPPLSANGNLAGNSSSNAANLNLPAVPGEVKSGFLQDLPTLSSAKKPAA